MFRDWERRRRPIRSSVSGAGWTSRTTASWNTSAWLRRCITFATFWEAREQPNVVLVHYADLQRDLEGEMRRIAHRLDIGIDERPPGRASSSRPVSTRCESERTSRARRQRRPLAEQSSVLPQRRHRPVAASCSTRPGGVDTPSESDSSHRPTSSSGHTTNPSATSNSVRVAGRRSSSAPFGRLGGWLNRRSGFGSWTTTLVGRPGSGRSPPSFAAA